jgi:hypothetical protein
MRYLSSGLSALSVALACATAASADVIPVAAGQSIQAALDAASAGDVLQLDAGLFGGNVDYKGKAVTIRGVGPDSVIEGAGDGPVVTFAGAETEDATLDSVTVTGGVAGLGGGIHIAGASPTVMRTVIRENRARFQGSGVYIEGGSPLLVNNLIVYNSSAQNDPHSIEIVNAAPMLVNNTIARSDSNGIILRGASAAVIMNNMIVYNGSSTSAGRRGRGICDFSGGMARIHFNLFARNRIAALLTNGQDYRTVARADSEIGTPRLLGNVDGPAAFAGRISRDGARVDIADFRLRGSRSRVPARDAGNPENAFNDVDGSRNDMGVGGGPLAPPWAR